MKLVVGLGNPGKKYEDTRHNAGYWLVDRLAADGGARFSTEKKFHGEVARLTSGSTDMWLLKPATFMNASGQAVEAFAGFYRIVPQDILIAHDELDLAPGVAKLKFGGGISGHNGLRDVVARLSTQAFWRLRIGIGHPRENAASEQEVIDYVLHAPRAEERAAIADAIARSLGVWPLLAEGKHEAAMHRLHTRTQVSGEP
ncbi:MAG: aminoacyl-tRNA hydrolase [Burkholderiales bacterium]|nr:aminoacyl-tRNA hydrolase [Burkholderiales bacterium]